jgi:hypothetical protein
VRLVRQPPGSKLCGHASLATVLGLTLDEVVAQAGTAPLGNWTIRQLYPGRLADPVDTEGYRVKPRPGVPAVCMTFPDNHAEHGHTIVWDGEKFLDPADGYAGAAPDLGWVVRWTMEVVR